MTRRSLSLLFVALLGCAPALPTPPSGEHVGETPVLVPFPPPPARADIVPDMPKAMKKPVWVDGQWMWHATRWVWEPGQWVDLPPKQIYARPTIVRLSDGKLHWFAGAFHDTP